MKTTLNPEVIYDAFRRIGLTTLRIDRFDLGNFADIRVEFGAATPFSLDQLNDLITKLRIMEKNENIQVRIVNFDTAHQTMRVHLQTRE